ncbi:hypothetical protein CEXT_335341 [Caerostris extrusa]|uniref:Uncharacterized protein n=1 Tax=Caerostris extrusa TaxID=172846 RepID=A0AAV4NNV5_CAEEX|nr:hypothetical protein CEXT_335341 [Caerostris extrusa]
MPCNPFFFPSLSRCFEIWTKQRLHDGNGTWDRDPGIPALIVRIVWDWMVSSINLVSPSSLDADSPPQTPSPPSLPVTLFIRLVFASSADSRTSIRRSRLAMAKSRILYINCLPPNEDPVRRKSPS